MILDWCSWNLLDAFKSIFSVCSHSVLMYGKSPKSGDFTRHLSSKFESYYTQLCGIKDTGEVNTSNLSNSPSKHAYYHRKTTMSVWIDLDSFIINPQDQGKVTTMILTNQSSSFNALPLDILILIAKLCSIGSSEQACHLIISENEFYQM